MKTKDHVGSFNNQSIGEEIANGITHGVGALASITGTVFLLYFSVISKDPWAIVGAAIYGASLILLYTMSTLYHSFTNQKVKAVFQIFDHCSIFFLILGTYAPFCLITLRGTAGWVLFGSNAFFAILGLILNIISIKRFHTFSLALYLLMGWSIVFAIKPIATTISFGGILLLVLGGLSYTIGVIFYRAQRPRYMHSIWHLFVLAGSFFHYFCILFYVLK